MRTAKESRGLWLGTAAEGLFGAALTILAFVTMSALIIKLIIEDLS
jgi:chromate transport protein ChrA